MLMAIDDKPVPQMSSTRFGMTTIGQWPLAKFIIDNLKPESVITYMDTEIWDYKPSYESLMSYARMILPDYVQRKHYPGNLEMRRACALMVGRVGIEEASYIQKWVLDDIADAAANKKMNSMYSDIVNDYSIPKYMLDSIPQFISIDTPVDLLEGAEPEKIYAPPRSGKSIAMERILKGLDIKTLTVKIPTKRNSKPYDLRNGLFSPTRYSVLKGPIK